MSSNKILRSVETGRRRFLKSAAIAAAAGVMPLPAGQAHAQSLAGDKSYAGNPATPAQPWTLPQRSTPPISIDVHTHWAPEAYMKIKADLGRADYADPIGHDMPRRVKWMDEHGVQTLVLTLGGFMPWEWVNAEQGAQIAQATNDAAINIHSQYPTRFLAGIELPVNSPEESLAELARVAGKPGMVAVHLPNSLASREYLFEPAFQPVMARIHEMGLPILMHPLDGDHNYYAGHRLDDNYSGISTKTPVSLFPGLTNSVGETFEQATTAAKLIVTGTLDRYPNLTVVFAHAGGAFPYIEGRLSRGGARNLKQPFNVYLRRYYYDSLTFNPLALKYLIDLVGSDRVVIGTDNAFAPQNMMEQPHSLVDQLNLPDADRDLILRGNLKRLFKLG